jgi:hypothetical protein
MQQKIAIPNLEPIPQTQAPSRLQLQFQQQHLVVIQARPPMNTEAFKLVIWHPTFRPSLHQAIFQKMNVLGCGRESTLFHCLGPGHMQKKIDENNLVWI